MTFSEELPYPHSNSIGYEASNPLEALSFKALPVVPSYKSLWHVFTDLPFTQILSESFRFFFPEI